MTEHIQIKNVRPKIQYIGDGQQTQFPYPFAIFKSGDIAVYFDDVKQESGFETTGIGNSTGGTVSFQTAPGTGTQVTLVRNLTIERTSDFQEGGQFRAAVLNSELDYQTACIQQIGEDLNRCLLLPPYANMAVNTSLPTPDANKAIVWNEDGSALRNSQVDIGQLDTVMKDLIDDTAETFAKAQEARAIAEQSAATVQSLADGIVGTVDGKANINSPALTGVPTAPTAATATNTNQLATTKFINNVLASFPTISEVILDDVNKYWAITLKNGMILQGGFLSVSYSSYGATTVNFVKPFTSFYTTYSGVGGTTENNASSFRSMDATKTLSSIQFKYGGVNNNYGNVTGLHWFAVGI